ncbi:MAG: hypothetical protein CHACPFDD_04192 [Phycisphaerae bacterium]|nr:hypothetical protein [Phycisphaerae bacterium]
MHPLFFYAVLSADLTVGPSFSELVGHSELVTFLALSDDGLTLASGGGEIIVWNVELAEERLRFQSRPMHAVAGRVVDGDRLMCGFEDRSIREFDLQTGREVSRVSCGPGSTTGIFAFSSDGFWALTELGVDGVYLWDLCRRRATRCFGKEQRTCFTSESLAITPDGRAAVSSGLNGHLYTYDLLQGQCADLASNTEYSLAAAISADGRIAVFGRRDGVLEIWDLAVHRCRRTYALTQGPITALAMTHSGAVCAVGSADGGVRIVRTSDGHVVWSQRAHKRWVHTVAISAHGTTIAASGGPPRGEKYPIKSDRNFSIAVWRGIVR